MMSRTLGSETIKECVFAIEKEVMKINLDYNILIALVDLQKKVDGKTHLNDGICDNVVDAILDSGNARIEDFGVIRNRLCDLFRGWPHHSGDPIFPVGVDNSPSAEAQFYECDNLWDGEYGNLRKDLLQYAIVNLRNIVDVQNERSNEMKGLSNTNTNYAILSALVAIHERLENGGIKRTLNQTMGLCDLVLDHITNDRKSDSIITNTMVRTTLCSLFDGWPHHSGNRTYPVYTGDKQYAQEQYANTINMWEGEYGERRKDLLHYTTTKLLNIFGVNPHTTK